MLRTGGEGGFVVSCTFCKAGFVVLAGWLMKKATAEDGSAIESHPQRLVAGRESIRRLGNRRW